MVNLNDFAGGTGLSLARVAMVRGDAMDIDIERSPCVYKLTNHWYRYY